MNIPLSEPVIIDLSKWNGPINISVLKNKAQAVILRVLCGIYEDARFEEYRQLLELAGIPWSPYIYWTATCDSAKVIARFKELCGRNVNGAWKFNGRFGAWIDLEAYSRPLGMSKETFYIKLLKFIQAFRTQTGILPGIYTSKGWWDANLPVNSLPASLGLQLWVANWNTTTPRLPREWATWTLHQYSANGNGLGQTYGVASRDIDINRYTANLETFNLAYKLKILPLGTEKPDYPVIVKANRQGCYVRSAPVIDPSTVVKLANAWTLFYPCGVKLDSQGRQWYLISTNPNRYVAAWVVLPM